MALLRGINVGGKNIVKMSDLRSGFEAAKCTNVNTYIQSGNVLFDSRQKNVSRLSIAIEKALAAECSCTSPVVLVTQEQLDRVVNDPPAGFGADPARYRYDVVFLRPPARAEEILPGIRLKPGVDEAYTRHGVLYFRRLTARASESYLPKLTRDPAYKSMTIRNWNTTRELYRLICSPLDTAT